MLPTAIAAALAAMASMATPPGRDVPPGPDVVTATDSVQGPVQLVRDDDKPPSLVIPVLHGLGLMTAMRGAETLLWPDPFARPEQFGPRYREAFTNAPAFDPARPVMEWDGDPWAVNTIGHALFGSELYLRARQCRLRWYEGLAFTAVGSALWEYGFEANGARPSALDLVYTPLSGLLLGEGRLALYEAAGHVKSRTARATLRAVVDPLGELERAFGTSC